MRQLGPNGLATKVRLRKLDQDRFPMPQVITGGCAESGSKLLDGKSANDNQLLLQASFQIQTQVFPPRLVQNIRVDFEDHTHATRQQLTESRRPKPGAGVRGLGRRNVRLDERRSKEPNDVPGRQRGSAAPHAAEW